MVTLDGPPLPMFCADEDMHECSKSCAVPGPAGCSVAWLFGQARPWTQALSAGSHLQCEAESALSSGTERLCLITT